MFRRVSEDPVPFGKITFWQEHYREFVCSVETAEWMCAAPNSTWDGVPVRFQVMDTLKGGLNVVVKVWNTPEIMDSAREIQAEQWVAA